MLPMVKKAVKVKKKARPSRKTLTFFRVLSLAALPLSEEEEEEPRAFLGFVSWSRMVRAEVPGTATLLVRVIQYPSAVPFK